MTEAAAPIEALEPEVDLDEEPTELLEEVVIVEDLEVTLEEVLIPGTLEVKVEREGDDVVLTVGGQKRTAQAPASGCKNPQTRFCTAIARVKSATASDRSFTAGCTNSPRLWRIPIERLSMIDTPIRIGAALRREFWLGTESFVRHQQRTDPLF